MHAEWVYARARNKDCVAETTERNIKNRTNRKRTALGRLCAERKGQTKLVSCSGEPKSKRYGMACVCSGIVHDEYRIVYDRYRQTLVIAKTKLFIVQESSTPFHLHSFACHIAFKRFTNNYKQHSMLRDWRRWRLRARGDSWVQTGKFVRRFRRFARHNGTKNVNSIQSRSRQSELSNLYAKTLTTS